MIERVWAVSDRCMGSTPEGVWEKIGRLRGHFVQEISAKLVQGGARPRAPPIDEGRHRELRVWTRRGGVPRRVPSG